jgi:hypothetical protein
MNRVLKYLKKHKIGKRLLSLLLCLLTVVCFGGILEPLQAHAVTGVEEIIMFVIGIMVACGVTFTSAEAAQSTARRYYNSVDSDTKSIIDKAQEQYDAKKEYYTVTTNGLIMCLASEWQKIFDSIAAFIYSPSVEVTSSFIDFNIAQSTFKNYDSFVSLLQNEGSLKFNFDCNSHAYSSFSVGSTMIEIIGSEVMGDVPAAVSDAFKSEWCIIKVTILGTGYTYYRSLNASSYQDQGIIYHDQDIVFSLTDNVINTSLFRGGATVSTSIPLIQPYYYKQEYVSPHGGFLYYQNHLVSATGSDSMYSLNIDSIGSLVCDDGTIFGTDYLINCDADKITDKEITKAFTCDPSIGVTDDYIGTDKTWTDSVADAGSGSIAFPLDVDDLIDLSPSDVRDKTLTDTGDIATDKTDTKDDTKYDTKDDTNTKPNKPSIPSLSLPEILFKEKFPFCLPWDVYNVFANLVAEPEAPVFSIPFKFERLGIDYEFTIDLSEFEDIAKISRFFSSIAFVIFLILASRKLIGAE